MRDAAPDEIEKPIATRTARLPWQPRARQTLPRRTITRTRRGWQSFAYAQRRRWPEPRLQAPSGAAAAFRKTARARPRNVDRHGACCDASAAPSRSYTNRLTPTAARGRHVRLIGDCAAGDSVRDDPTKPQNRGAAGTRTERPPARRPERASPVDPGYARPRLRPFKSIVVILAALAAIIALSLASVHMSNAGWSTNSRRRRASRRTPRSRCCRRGSTRSIRTPACWPTWSNTPARADGRIPATERRGLGGAFRALAVVVSQYRTIALVERRRYAGGPGDGSGRDSRHGDGVDSGHAAPGAEVVSSKGAQALGEPARIGDRSFSSMARR